MRLRGVGQLINVVYKRMHAQATDKLKECKTATNTNSCLYKDDPRILTNKLLSFRHEEFILFSDSRIWICPVEQQIQAQDIINTLSKYAD